MPVCRLWSGWIDTQSKNKSKNQYSNGFSSLFATLSPESTDSSRMKGKQQFMITYRCYFSIEMNAHSLTYLVLCAIEGHIPFEVNALRSPRSMSGVSSSIVNFTVFDLSRRVDKISAIQAIRMEHEAGLPVQFTQTFPGSRRKHTKVNWMSRE